MFCACSQRSECHLVVVPSLQSRAQRVNRPSWSVVNLEKPIWCVRSSSSLPSSITLLTCIAKGLTCWVHSWKWESLASHCSEAGPWTNYVGFLWAILLHWELPTYLLVMPLVLNFRQWKNTCGTGRMLQHNSHPSKLVFFLAPFGWWWFEGHWWKR